MRATLRDASTAPVAHPAPRSIGLQQKRLEQREATLEGTVGVLSGLVGVCLRASLGESADKIPAWAEAVSLRPVLA